MSYKQVRDVLTTIRSFHRELGTTCERLSRQTGDVRIQLLLDIVRKHERRLAEVFDRYEEEGAEAVMDTWLQYTPTEQIQSALDSAQVANADSVAKLAQVVWDFEQALIELYRQLAESTAAQRVQELFGALLELEEAKTGIYAWSLKEFQNGPDAPLETEI